MVFLRIIRATVMVMDTAMATVMDTAMVTETKATVISTEDMKA